MIGFELVASSKPFFTIVKVKSVSPVVVVVNVFN